MAIRFDPPSTNSDPSTGDVVIEPTSSGGTLEIKDDTGSTQIEITSTGTNIGGNTLGVDSSAININQSGSIVGLVNTIIEAEDNTGKIPSANAVIDFVHNEVSGALIYVEKTSKADFDTMLALSEIEPSIVLVTDSIPFDYTDTKGLAEVGLTWWLGIVQKELSGSLSTSTLFNSNSQDSLTGAEISAALFSESNTNNFTDAYKSALDNIDDKLDVESTGKNVVIDNPGAGNGQLIFRNSAAPVNNRDFALVARSDGTFDFESLADNGDLQARWTYTHSGESNFPSQITQAGNNVLDVTDSKYVNLPNDTQTAIDAKAAISGQVFTGVVEATALGTTSSNAQQSIAIGNGGVNDSGDSMIAWRVGSSSSGRSGNYRAQVGMNYDSSRFEIKIGNKNNPSSLQTAVSIDSGANVSINGSPALTQANMSSDMNDNNPDNVPNTSLVKNYVDSTSSFNGVRTLGDGITPAITAKRSNNTNDVTMLATQNSGAFFVNRLYTDEIDGGKVKLSVGGDSDITALTDVIEVSSTAFKTNVDLEVAGSGDISSSLNVGGTFSMFDNSNREMRFEKNSSGIKLRAVTNPTDGDAIFQIESSGGSKRLTVPHIGDLTTSNTGIKVGTNSDGSGGSPVLTPDNIGDLIASRTYVDSFPTLSINDVVLWFQQKADVQFVSVGAGTINLPQIVGSNPSSSQVLAGSTIVLTNYNNGSAINLSRFNSYQKWMVDNVGDIRASETVSFFDSSKIALQALDLRELSSVGSWCWAIRGI